MSAPNERRFEAELEIHAAPSAVWEALASGVGLRRWFAPSAEVQPGVGGSIVWNWGEHHTWPQRIEIWEPGRRLLTRYDSAVDAPAGGKVPLFMDFTLEGERGRTTLRLVHAGFGKDAAFDAEYDGISHGWPVELQSLRLYLERHDGRDRRIAWSVLPIDLPLDEAWRVLTGPSGIGCGPRFESLTAGTPFRIETADGDVFKGEALHCHRREFTGVARNHGDAFLRVSVESCGGQPQVWLWLSTWDRPAGEVAALESRWNAMLARLFASASTAAVSRG